MKRLSALLICLALMLALGAPAYAASTTTASVPVTLTVANEYRAINVSVPASLPVEVINGEVLTANDVCITNNSKTGSIRVTAISVTDGAYKVASYTDFSGSRAIALSINGCATRGSGELTITETAFPAISAGESQRLGYFAKVSADAANAEDIEAANAIFTISTEG